METIQSIILGATQGITEFLPISSSGHLVIIPFLFGWEENKLAFDVALHLGTVIALAYVFWKDWLLLLKSAVGRKQPADSANCKLQTANQKNPYAKDLLWQILIASIPAALVGLLIDNYVEKYLHHPILLALNLVLFGFILWYVDKKYAKGLKLGSITYGKSFFIGIAQSIALVPGISRSGVTMTAARMMGLDRENAARYSFLIGMPAMVGAFLFKLKDLGKEDLNLPFFLGIIASAVFGMMAIKFLLDYLKKSDFSVFLWYRIVLAIIVIIIWLT